MTQEQILYALGDVQDSYILESMPTEGRRRTKHILFGNRKRVMYAGILCAAAVLIVIAWRIVTVRQQGSMSQMAQIEPSGAAITETAGIEAAEAEQSEAVTEPAEIETGDAGGTVTEASSADERFVDVRELLASAESARAAVTKEDLTQMLWRVPVGAYIAMYEGTGNTGDAAFQEELYAAKGSLYADSAGVTHDSGAVYAEGDGLYYVSGHTDRQYLIRVQDGAASLWKFVCFDAADYPFRDVLTEVYDIHSADGITELRVFAGNMDNTTEGIRIQREIGTSVVTDRASLQELYRILSDMTCYGRDRWDLIQTGSAEADVSGSMEGAHQEVRMTRYLTIVTPYQEIDRLKYTAVSGMFYEFDGIAYTPLSEADAQIMQEMLEIE